MDNESKMVIRGPKNWDWQPKNRNHKSGVNERGSTEGPKLGMRLSCVRLCWSWKDVSAFGGCGNEKFYEILMRGSPRSDRSRAAGLKRGQVGWWRECCGGELGGVGRVPQVQRKAVGSLEKRERGVWWVGHTDAGHGDSVCTRDGVVVRKLESRGMRASTNLNFVY